MTTRTKAFLFLAPAIVVAGALVLPARAQESDEVSIAKGLIARGIYEPAIGILDQMKPIPPDGLVLKGRALSGMAREEKDAGKKQKLADEAKQVLEEAAKKGAKDAAAVLERVKKGELEPVPGGTFQPAGEIDLGRKLLQRGMVGAAEALADRVLKQPGLSPEDKTHALALRADSYVARSRARDTAPEKRKEYFEKAKGVYEEVLKSATEQSAVFDARVALYELYITRGNGLTEAAKREADLQTQEQLKKEAIEAFKDGETFLKGEYDKWLAEKDKAAPAPTPAPEEGKEGGGGGAQGGGGQAQAAGEQKMSQAEEAYMLAGYYYAKALVGHATALGKNEEHDKILKQAIEFYQNYNLEWGQQFIGFEAAIDMGDAYLELGDEESAIQTYIAAAGIEKLYDPEPLHPDPKKKYPVPSSAVDVIARSSLKLGKLYLKKRDGKKALAVLDRTFHWDPKFVETPIGMALVIERAEAKFLEGRKPDANKDLEDLMKKDPTGPVGQAARAKQASLSGKRGGGGGFEGVDAETAVVRAEQSLESGDIPTAMTMARLGIILGREDVSRSAKLLPKAYLLLGEVYLRQARFYEAVIAFNEVTKRWAQSPEGPQAGLKAVQCYQSLKQSAPSAWDNDRYTMALEAFGKQYPTEGKGAIQYLLARAEMEEGDYAKAVELFEKVQQDAGRPYDDSRFLIGVCHYLAAKQLKKEKKDDKERLDKASSALRSAIEVYGKTAGIAEDRQKTRKDLDAEARFLLSDILLTLDKADEVLKLLEKLDDGAAQNPERLARTGLLRILAWNKLGDLAKAEAQLKTLLDKASESRKTILAARDVALALDRMCWDAKDPKYKQLPPAEKRAALGRAADYYATWILQGPKAGEVPTPREMKEAADRLFLFACEIAELPENTSFFGQLDTVDPKGARKVFETAGDIYTKLKGEQAIKDKVHVLAQAGECYGFVGKWKECTEALQALVVEAKMVVADGDPKRMIPAGGLDRDLMLKREELIGWYFDLGRAYFERAAPIGEKAEKSPLVKKGLDVFSNVITNTVEGKKVWWRAKWEYFHGLDVRGEKEDYDNIKAGLRSLERSNPDWDGGKFGIREKFLELKKKVGA